MSDEFIRYQKVKRYGTEEVIGIENGECHVFGKLDGTNSSLWMDSDLNLRVGSRNRELSIENDNFEFYKWALNQEHIKKFFKENDPNIRLYGEWLIPHSLKTYREGAWRDFYVFDVVIDKEPDEIRHEGDDKVKYLPYDEYKPLLEEYGIEYIPPIAIVEEGNYEKFVDLLDSNTFLIEDGKGIGEGIVIKNYNFFNDYGRQVWAKVVTNKHKELNTKEMGARVVKGKKSVEQKIVLEFVTQAKVDKLEAKIKAKHGDVWASEYIPELLGRAYYELIDEEAWEFVKEFNRPTIDFSKLKYKCDSRIKQLKKELFV